MNVRIRAFVVAALASSLSLFGCSKASAACAKDSLLDLPQLCPDREGLGFSQEFGTGTPLGRRDVETLLLRNGGLKNLDITSITTSGDPAFQFTSSWDQTPNDNKVEGTSVAPNKTAAIEVQFRPTEGRAYTATLTVQSNAQNAPSKTFQISGCGVPTDGGTSPCYRFVDCTLTNDAGVSICVDAGKP
jgi:hypothetical protein